MRGIYASLSIKALKRNHFRKKIATLNQRVRQAEEHRESLVQHLKEIRNHYKEYIEDIQNLEKFLSEIRLKIDALLSDYMTLEEARKRLKHLETK